MDKLLALRMFVATVNGGGFSAAGRAMGLATSSVTRMVDALERELGSALLNRSSRGVSLTETGSLYLGRAQAILAAMEEADQAVADRDGSPRGALRVSLPVEFARRVVSPGLAGFLADHPALELTLTLTDEVIDLHSQRVDVSVRLGNLTHTDDIVVRPVGRFERWLVASPAYLATHGMPRQASELSRHACLLYDYGSLHSGWQLPGERLRLEVNGPLRSNNADLLRQAAAEGAGIALLADWLVREDVQAGRLVRLLAQQPVSPGQASTAINLVYLPNQRGSVRVARFAGWLEAQMAKLSMQALR